MRRRSRYIAGRSQQRREKYHEVLSRYEKKFQYRDQLLYIDKYKTLDINCRENCCEDIYVCSSISPAVSPMGAKALRETVSCEVFILRCVSSLHVSRGGGNDVVWLQYILVAIYTALLSSCPKPQCDKL